MGDSIMKQQRRASNRGSRRRGNTIVEFAVSVPVFLMMVMGAVDFGRLFYEATTLSNASESGGIYGAAGMQYATNANGVQAAAQADAADVTGFTATPILRCACPTSMTDFYSETEWPCDTECTNGYGSPRVYVRTEVEKNFKTFGWYPGVPQSTEIDMNRWVRAQ